MAHREARQVHGPDLVGGRDLVLAEQIGEHLVSRVWLGSPGMPVERRYPHQAHHGRHVLRADDHPSKPQQVLEHPVPGEGVFPPGYRYATRHLQFILCQQHGKHNRRAAGTRPSTLKRMFVSKHGR